MRSKKVKFLSITIVVVTLLVVVGFGAICFRSLKNYVSAYPKAEMEGTGVLDLNHTYSVSELINTENCERVMVDACWTDGSTEGIEINNDAGTITIGERTGTLNITFNVRGRYEVNSVVYSYQVGNEGDSTVPTLVMGD